MMLTPSMGRLLQQSCIPSLSINKTDRRTFVLIDLMRKKLLFYILFFAGLFGCFYAVMVYTTDFEKVKLPILNTVQPFTFMRQDSTMVSQADFSPSKISELMLFVKKELDSL